MGAKICSTDGHIGQETVDPRRKRGDLPQPWTKMTRQRWRNRVGMNGLQLTEECNVVRQQLPHLNALSTIR